MAEGLPTLIALVGLLPSVEACVANQECAFVEGLPTFTALIGIFSYVDSLVVNDELWLKALSHSLHLKGLSPT